MDWDLWAALKIGSPWEMCFSKEFLCTGNPKVPAIKVDIILYSMIESKKLSTWEEHKGCVYVLKATGWSGLYNRRFQWNPGEKNSKVYRLTPWKAEIKINISTAHILSGTYLLFSTAMSESSQVRRREQGVAEVAAVFYLYFYYWTLPFWPSARLHGGQ